MRGETLMFKRKKKPENEYLTDCEKLEIKRQKTEAFEKILRAKKALEDTIEAEMPFTSFTHFIGKKK